MNDTKASSTGTHKQAWMLEFRLVDGAWVLVGIDGKEVDGATVKVSLNSGGV